MSQSTKTLPPTASDPGRLTQLATQIAAGDLSPVDLMQRCLDRIDAVESEVHAWRVIDRERAMELARKQ